MPSRNGQGDDEPLDPVEVVADLYRAVLRREPDQAGLEQFVADMRAGGRVRDVAEAILFSREAGWTLLTSGFLVAFPEMLWADRPGQARRDQLCFMHMMKTGGTSLTAMLGQLFGSRLSLSGIVAPDQLIVLPPLLLDNVSLVSGHLSYEAVEHFFPRAAVCTVIRDPLERALSHYAHLCRDELVRQEHPELTLEEFVESPQWCPLHTNYQARHLVHRIDLHRAWTDYSPVERLADLGATSARRLAAPIQGLFEATPMVLDGSALEAAAVERLESLEFVGVTEHLADLAIRIAEHVGCEPPGLTHENPGGRRLEARDLPPSLARRLREANGADYACYEYARRQTTIMTRRGFIGLGK
jgi:hypothetical protein